MNFYSMLSMLNDDGFWWGNGFEFGIHQSVHVYKLYITHIEMSHIFHEFNEFPMGGKKKN